MMGGAQMSALEEAEALGHMAARLGAGSRMVATSGAHVAQRDNPPNRSWAWSSASWRPFLG
jgi:hypothetical protein